jgi:hypothetical protein
MKRKPKIPTKRASPKPSYDYVTKKKTGKPAIWGGVEFTEKYRNIQRPV